ncbi:MAG TPA: heme ABC exporter ATP-binding protein CcmA [Rhizomicrobium sp.]
MISLLTAENLACIRGERCLFAGLSFRVEQGKALCIQGPNGAGKTSLLRLIAGFLTPESGAVRFAAKDNSEIAGAEERGKEIGWLGHQDGLKAHLTVAEQLTFFAKLYGAVPDIAPALEMAGLARQGELACRYLSAGQKKRLALARLKLIARPIWLLDEPLAALDESGKGLAADMITQHCAQGGIVLAATHEKLGTPAATLTLGAA